MYAFVKRYLIRFRWFRRLPVKVTLNAIVYKEDNEWIAHCLQMDLVATGAHSKEAICNLFDLIKAQIEFAEDNNNFAAVFRPAPPDAWARLAHVRKCRRKNLKAEKSLMAASPFNQEVDLCFA
jgi:hypothetical protein